MVVEASHRHCAAIAVALSAAPAAYAQDKTVELKISSWVPPAHSLTAAFEDWGKSIEAASKGTIKYKVFPSQQLGKAPDHYDMAARYKNLGNALRGLGDLDGARAENAAAHERRHARVVDRAIRVAAVHDRGPRASRARRSSPRTLLSMATSTKSRVACTLEIVSRGPGSTTTSKSRLPARNASGLFELF